jgi:hypothetical protein
MPRVFISYRHDGAAGEARALCDDLRDALGRENVFRDIDGLAPGEQFLPRIEAAIADCDVLLAIIGKRWTTTRAGGQRRLDNPNDVVRLEIATALRTKKIVIPVLVQDVGMPRPEQLPADLAGLAGWQAVELSDKHWAIAIGELVKSLKALDPPSPTSEPPNIHPADPAPPAMPSPGTASSDPASSPPSSPHHASGLFTRLTRLVAGKYRVNLGQHRIVGAGVLVLMVIGFYVAFRVAGVDEVFQAQLAPTPVLVASPALAAAGASPSPASAGIVIFGVSPEPAAPSSSPAPSPAARPASQAQVNADGALLRTLPSMGASIVRNLDPGMPVTYVDAVSVDAEGATWAHVRTAGGSAGWALAQFLTSEQTPGPAATACLTAMRAGKTRMNGIPPVLRRLSLAPNFRFSLDELCPVIEDKADRYGVDPRLLTAILALESDFTNYQSSRNGTHGLFSIDDKSSLFPAFESATGVSIGTGPDANVMPAENQIEFLAWSLASRAARLNGDQMAAAQSWAVGESNAARNSEAGKNYQRRLEQLIAGLFGIDAFSAASLVPSPSPTRDAQP